MCQRILAPYRAHRKRPTCQIVPVCVCVEVHAKCCQGWKMHFPFDFNFLISIGKCVRRVGDKLARKPLTAAISLFFGFLITDDFLQRCILKNCWSGQRRSSAAAAAAAAAASQLSVCRVPRSQAELETHLMLWAVADVDLSVCLPSDSCLPAAGCLLFSPGLPPCLSMPRFVCCHRASYFSNSFQLVLLLLHPCLPTAFNSSDDGSCCTVSLID